MAAPSSPARAGTGRHASARAHHPDRDRRLHPGPMSTPSARLLCGALLRDGASGVSSIRLVNPSTCPIDGWLALRPARAPRPQGRTARPRAPRPRPARPSPIRTWWTPRRFRRSPRAGVGGIRHDSGQPAILGATEPAGTRLAGRVTTLAIGPGAAIVLATADGTATAYTPVDWSSVTSDARHPDRRHPPDRDRRGDGLPRSARDPEKASGPADQVAAIDDRIARVVGARFGRPDTVIVAGLADGGSVPHAPCCRAWPGVRRGWPLPPLDPHPRSDPERRPDGHLCWRRCMWRCPLEPGAILRQERSGPADNAGAAARRTHLVDIDQASHEVRLLVPPFFAACAEPTCLLSAGLAGLEQGREPATRARPIRAVQIIVVAAAAVPAATFLANLLPWWRASATLPAIGVRSVSSSP